jgi:hypothetical protein
LMARSIARPSSTRLSRSARSTCSSPNRAATPRAALPGPGVRPSFTGRSEPWKWQGRTRRKGERAMKAAIYARVSTVNSGQDPTMQTRELEE